MRQEFYALESTNTWSVAPLPYRKKPIGCKWVYKIKYRADDSLERYKARLVVQGVLRLKVLIFMKYFPNDQNFHYQDPCDCGY